MNPIAIVRELKYYYKIFSEGVDHVKTEQVKITCINNATVNR